MTLHRYRSLSILHELCEAEVRFLLTTVNCAVRGSMKVHCNCIILLLIIDNSYRSPGLFEKKQVVALSQTFYFVYRFCISETWLVVL